MNWLNQRNISKKNLLFGWHTSFWFLKSQGANMTGNYKSLIQNVGTWGMILTILFKFDLAKIGKWIIILALIDVGVDLLIGYQRVKHGMLEYESNYLSKKKSISPFNYELQKTVENIADKVGAKKEFTRII